MQLQNDKKKKKKIQPKCISSLLLVQATAHIDISDSLGEIASNPKALNAAAYTIHAEADSRQKRLFNVDTRLDLALALIRRFPRCLSAVWFLMALFLPFECRL